MGPLRLWCFVFFLLVAALFPGCSDQSVSPLAGEDESAELDFLGVWRADFSTAVVTLTLSPDSTYSWVVSNLEGETQYAETGTWLWMDSALFLHVECSDDPRGVGSTYRFAVYITADKQVLMLISVAGKIWHWGRIS